MIGSKHSVSVTVALASLLLMLCGCAGAAAPPSIPAQVTVSPELDRLIDQAQTALEGKKATVSDLLANPYFLPAHGSARFRQLIRQHAQAEPLNIVTPQEPGASLTVRGTVLDKNGQPLKGALVYFYQTNAQGVYTADGQAGGQLQSRLFGYLLTDAAGRYELRTIRPGSYPQTTIQEHIHVEIEPPGNTVRPYVTEIVFDDDKNLNRAQVTRAGYVVAVVTYEGQKQRTTANFQLR